MNDGIRQSRSRVNVISWDPITKFKYIVLQRRSSRKVQILVESEVQKANKQIIYLPVEICSIFNRIYTTKPKVNVDGFTKEIFMKCTIQRKNY